MYYYYTDAAGEAAGPAEQSVLHDAVCEGVLTPGTLAVEEGGGEEWRPLSQLLKYHYAIDSEVFGPVRLAELPALAGARGHDLLVMPEGGTAWLPVAAVLRLPPPRPALITVRGTAAAPGHGDIRVRGLYMPDGAKVAGGIWFLFGVMKIIACLVMLAGFSGVPVRSRDVILFGWGLTLFAAVVFIWAGLQTCNGRARSLRGNGTGSLGLGFCAIFAGVRGWVPDTAMARTEAFVSGAALILAGLLAHVAHRSYCEWRKGTRRR